MFSNQYMLDNLVRQKDRIDEMIYNYQNPQQPVNIFNNPQTPVRDLVELRVLNESEEVDNLYVSNKTLFINDSTMIIKGVDGKLEKWEVKKIYPVDKKDERINELESEVKKLKEMINNEYSESSKSVRELEQPYGDVNGYAKPKPKTTSKPISESK